MYFTWGEKIKSIAGYIIFFEVYYMCSLSIYNPYYFKEFVFMWINYNIFYILWEMIIQIKTTKDSLLWFISLCIVNSRYFSFPILNVSFMNVSSFVSNSAKLSNLYRKWTNEKRFCEKLPFNCEKVLIKNEKMKVILQSDNIF